MDRTAIADALRRDITTGKLRAGDKLPPQRELAKRFGAAPNTVGEAVRTLAAEGLVERKTTSRAIVLAPDAAADDRDDIIAACEDLQGINTELRMVRDRLSALEHRVSDAVERLSR